MPSGLPKPEILLQAAIAYLREELLPTLSGYHAYQVRVTISVLGILQRSFEKGAALDADERQRLVELLGAEGSRTALNDMLVERISKDEVSLDDPQLRDHILRSLDEALQINNPKWLKN
ncbi:MAG: hypothetical protein K0S54_1358 [Alphaproteobacteria bacterium]|jgi:hypothetical protein|nr:hypothetical protein [Alphaproteobacteria bacterium]